jgi:uncharacterized protein (TIGR03435 family)
MRGVSGRSWAPGYFDRPVIDLTGIEGSFDFTLGWTGKQRIQDGRNRPAAAVPDFLTIQEFFNNQDRPQSQVISPQ